mgnify:CR=1 FL=1
MGTLYSIAFTIKMSYKGSHKIEGYFSYVVPPLEGLWQQEGMEGIDYTRKNELEWISMIRLPEICHTGRVHMGEERSGTKERDRRFQGRSIFRYEEGLCVQCMHIGSYDEEPETIRKMEEYVKEAGYRVDLSEGRKHHEIYLSDPRRTAPERLKTVIRQPVCRKDG